MPGCTGGRPAGPSWNHVLMERHIMHSGVTLDALLRCVTSSDPHLHEQLSTHGVHAAIAHSVQQGHLQPSGSWCGSSCNS